MSPVYFADTAHFGAVFSSFAVFSDAWYRPAAFAAATDLHAGVVATKALERHVLLAPRAKRAFVSSHFSYGSRWLGGLTGLESADRLRRMEYQQRLP
ncbi:hypothetical protein ACMDCR_05110 [Labrys okinawensis]|uniref:hypothetical protein n=1 Tax=Labrys okinawensis TaxID=346911 RepID=UPI0039BCD237